VGIQERIVKFITATNWILLGLTSLVGFFLMPPAFARGVAFGGLIVTINFHLLSRTLKKAFRPPHLAPVNAILAKYYIRFIISGIIIFFLIRNQYVNPLGLVVGLSVVVASMFLATILEVKKLILKEAL